VASAPDASLDTGSDTDSIDDTKAPYEATWMELAEVGDSYVVYNYLDWYYTSDTDGEKYRTPTIIRIRGNQLIKQYYHEAEHTSLFDSVEIKDNGVYLFRIIGGEYSYLIDSLGPTKYSGKYSFQWIDKKKHIARWIKYYDGYYDKDRIMLDDLYIDSAYNKYPIVNYEIKHPSYGNEEWGE